MLYDVLCECQKKTKGGLTMIEWITANWPTCLAIFYGLEKLVKLTPSKYDDILIDVIFNSVKKVFGKK